MIQSRFAARAAVAFSLVMLAASTARSQAIPTATAPGASITVGGTYSAFEARYPQGVQGGAGVFVDVNVRHAVGVEGEVHFLRQNQIEGSYETTYLVGPRLELHRGPLSPFAKALVGDGKLTFPYKLGYGNYLVVGGGGGLDYQISNNLKIRVFDFEYQYWPQFTLGSIAPYGVSAGISYRVVHTGGWRHHHYR